MLRGNLERKRAYERSEALKREFYEHLRLEGYKIVHGPEEDSAELNNRVVYAEAIREGVKVRVVYSPNNSSGTKHTLLRFLITDDKLYRGIGRLNQEVLKFRKNGRRKNSPQTSLRQLMSTETVPNDSEHFGGTGLPPDRILKLKPDAVITFGMGPNALVRFQKAKVAVLRADSGAVKVVISGYLKNQLQELTEGCHHALYH